MTSYKPTVTMDTSALVKWFKNEEESERALKLRSWAEVGANFSFTKKPLLKK